MEASGCFVLQVKNPTHAAPAGMGLAKDRKAHFPADLADAAFGGLEGGYAWGPATVGNGALLDHEHAERWFVGVADETGEGGRGFGWG